MSKTPKPVSLAPVKSLDRPLADLGKAASAPAPAMASSVAKAKNGTSKAAAVEKLSSDIPAPRRAAIAETASAPKAAATKTAAPKTAAPKPVNLAPAASRVVAPASVEIKPVAAGPVAASAAAGAKSPRSAETVAKRKPDRVVAGAPKPASARFRTTQSPDAGMQKPPVKPVAVAAVSAPKKPKAAPAAPKVAVVSSQPLLRLALPGTSGLELPVPGFGADLVAGMAQQMLAVTRTVGEIQSALLDHNVAQLKAGMDELEACVRSTTPSEVVVIQARSVRRSAEDLTTVIKSVSARAAKGFKKD